MSSHVPKKIARATRGAQSIKVLSTSISLLYVGMRPPPHRTYQIEQAWSNDSTDGSQHYSGPAREFYRAEGLTATVNVRVSENLVTSVHLFLMLWKTEAKHFNYLQLSKWKKKCNSGSVRSRETNAPDGCGTARLDSTVEAETEVRVQGHLQLQTELENSSERPCSTKQKQKE